MNRRIVTWIQFKIPWEFLTRLLEPHQIGEPYNVHQSKEDFNS